ncbi:MAG: bacteriocin family protein [Planctomycetaceae bacterium]|jgi:hypothetical protein|nr:bacteriocin family protein [Planctomycetaceae bacterium]
MSNYVTSTGVSVGDIAGSGNVTSLLLQNNFDPRCCRPFLMNGRSYLSKQVGFDVKTGKPIIQNVPTYNAATLRREDWIMIDRAVVTAARPRLRFFNELRSAGLNVDLPNALGKTVWQYERQSNITGATVSMDGIRKGDADRPMYDMEQMPLPVIHKDFSFSARQIAVARNSNSPIDASTAAAASQRVAEEVEKLALGVAESYTFGGGKVYGLLNYPSRLTRVFTNPWYSNGERNPNWTPGILHKEILASRRALSDKQHYGPFVVYVSSDFDEVLDDDYNIGTAGVSSSITLRERLGKVDAIKAIRTSEFLPKGSLIMLEMDQNTIQAITGLDVTTIQWQTEGGFEIHFKVLCMLLPRLKSDFYGNCGIMHGALAPASDSSA